MGRVRNSSWLDCKGKALDRVMEKETCFVSINLNFASVLIINTTSSTVKCQPCVTENLLELLQAACAWQC